MDHDAALAALPEAMATALRLDDAQLGAAVIATALGIDPSGVPGLLQVARRKLRRLLNEPLRPNHG